MPQGLHDLRACRHTPFGGGRTAAGPSPCGPPLCDLLFAVTDAATQRTAARSRWPGRRTTLARQTDAALVLNGTAAERVAMV